MMTGIVLSGGENRRMGTDKAFLKIGGIPMIERVLSSLQSVCRDVIIVTNAPHRYTAYGVTVATDVYDKRGPLTGILSGLLRSSEEHNLVVACDMPFLNAPLLAYMADQAPGHDIVVPEIKGLFEPLHAVYSRRLVPVIEEQIRRDRQRIRELFANVRLRCITEQEIDRFDPERKSFKNLNTPKDYEEATCAG